MASSAFLRAAGLAACVASMCASAQPFPTKPLRWINPYAAGGGSDLTTRLIANRLSESLGQQVVVDNRIGASGNIGAEIAARAPADGYTLITITASFAPNHAVTARPRVDLVKDFSYITQLTTQPYILLVPASSAARNPKELVALARRSATPFTYGSSGVATLQHLAGVMFGSMSGTQFVHVPYKGGSLALTDIVGGRLQFFFGVILSSMPHMKSGKLRPLAVTSTRRARIFPELPTVAESGFPGYAVNNWYSAAAPANTPPEIVKKLHTEIVRALNSSEVEQRLRNDGSEPGETTPQEMATIVREDLQRWRKYVKETGIRTDS
jgi:tripartite-type tricarboxylate transporter receptor subunit TctC